jgi:hypothetical protein
MSNESGGFRRRMWHGSNGTDIPLPPRSNEDNAFVDTRSWQPSLNTAGQPLLWFIVAQPIDQRGSVLPIAPNTIVGRRGDIRWHDPRMSRQHAHIRLMRHPDDPKRQVYAIEPLNDRNGTFINGHEITTLTMLLENDEIAMGDTLFVVKVLE